MSVSGDSIMGSTESKTSLPKAIIVDIDGTLAHIKNRSPFDWERVDEDSLDEVVATSVKAIKDQGYSIILVSGRDGKAYAKTISWLDVNNVEYDHIFMRKAGDKREDTVVKKEIYQNNIEHRYDVECVFEDRPKVIRMWRSIGLRVIDVGNGIEF